MVWIAGCTESHPATQPVAERTPAPEPMEAPTILDQRIESISFEQTPLQEAIQVIREKTGKNIYVHWRALEDAGVKRDTPVNVRLRDVKLGAALRATLADAAGNVKVGVAVEDGVITASTKADLACNVMTRVYDIRDLTVPIPDFETGPNGLQPTTQPTREENVSAIRRLLTETIDPDGWSDSTNKMCELSGQLIVTATPETQSQITALLDQLRECRAIQISLEMRFVSIDPDRLPKNVADALRQSFGKKPPETKIAFLSPEQTDELIRQAVKLPESSLISAPRITIFNGQRAFVNVSTSQAYVAGMNVIQSADGKTGYDPEIKNISTGVQIDACATASADRKYVTVSLKPTLSKLLSLKTEQYKNVKDLMIQVPEVQTQSISTTASVPDRQTMIVGGLVDRDVQIEGKPNPVSRPIFLLVKPSLIVQREVASR
jgi:hypothetical protein